MLGMVLPVLDREKSSVYIFFFGGEKQNWRDPAGVCGLSSSRYNNARVGVVVNHAALLFIA